MIRRPPRSTQSRSSAASDVYKRQDLAHRRGDVGDSSGLGRGSRARSAGLRADPRRGETTAYQGDDPREPHHCAVRDGDPGMSWREAAAPLRERNFAWYFASRFTNTLGSMMAGIALTFAVLDLTDSVSALGMVLAAHTIPMVLFLLFGGVIADRFPRTLVLQLSNLSSALVQGIVAYLVISGTAELWMLIALEAVHGTVSAISFPAMASMVPQLVPRDQLQRANALLSLSRGSLTIIGPTLGALLVVTAGSGWALAVDAATWLLAAILLLAVAVPEKAREGERAGTIAELRDGWKFFIGTTWLWVVVLAFGFLNAIHAGAWFTLGPALANETIGKQGWGFVLSAESVGLLLMTAILLWVPLKRPLRVGMLGCSLTLEAHQRAAEHADEQRMFEWDPEQDRRHQQQPDRLGRKHESPTLLADRLVGQCRT